MVDAVGRSGRCVCRSCRGDRHVLPPAHGRRRDPRRAEPDQHRGQRRRALPRSRVDAVSVSVGDDYHGLLADSGVELTALIVNENQQPYGVHMRYEALGPLRIVTENGVVPVSARKSEIVLTALLARSGQVLSVGQLVDEVWGEDMPQRATSGLHVHVSHVRKLLKSGGRTKSPIVTRSPGYLLSLGDDEFDVHDFQRLVREGKAYQRADEHELAVKRLRAALGLWRGPVPGIVPTGPIISGFSVMLAELRLECVDALIESRIALGDYTEMIGFLYGMIAEYPLKESFYQQLMVALYRTGRRADALRVYQDAHQILSVELGLEPCLSMRGLQAEILGRDSAMS